VYDGIHEGDMGSDIKGTQKVAQCDTVSDSVTWAHVKLHVVTGEETREVKRSYTWQHMKLHMLTHEFTHGDTWRYVKLHVVTREVTLGNT